MFPRQLLVKILVLFTGANESLIELRLRRVVRAYLLNRHVMLCVIYDLRLIIALFLFVIQQVDKILIILVELIGYSLKLNHLRLLDLFILHWHLLLLVILPRTLLVLELLVVRLHAVLPFLLLARLIEQVDVAQALVVSLAGLLADVEAVVDTLLSAVPALLVEVVVLVVPVDLLVSSLVLELNVVLVVDGVEEVVVEGLLALALDLFLVLGEAVVGLAVLLVAEGLAVVEAVDGAWALACIVVEGLVLVHGVAAVSCFSIH